MGGFRDYLLIFVLSHIVLPRKCPKSSQILNIVQFWSVQLNSEGSIGHFFGNKTCLMNHFGSFWDCFLIFWRHICFKHVILSRCDQKLSIFSPRSGSYAKYGLNGLKMEPLGLQTSKIPIFHSKFSEKAVKGHLKAEKSFRTWLILSYIPLI